MLNKEKIEKEFDEKFMEYPVNSEPILAPFGEEGSNELKQFINQTILDVIDDVAGEERYLTLKFNNDENLIMSKADIVKDENFYYNKFRKEILDYKENFN